MRLVFTFASVCFFLAVPHLLADQEAIVKMNDPNMLPSRHGGKCISWVSPEIPFSFKYGGRNSQEFLHEWKWDIQTQEQSDWSLKTYTISDHNTGLYVIAQFKEFRSYPAVELVLRFHNRGNKDTPVIQDIKPLLLECNTFENGTCFVHHSRGSNAKANDFEPLDTTLGFMTGEFLRIASENGRSSSGALPFANLEAGDGGIIIGIGWTGDWVMDFNVCTDFTNVAKSRLKVNGGMQRISLKLHPDEQIRSPSVLLLNWHGDIDAAHNIWRKLILEQYSPKYNDKVIQLPIAYGVWGGNTDKTQLSKIDWLIKNNVGADTFWVDAGWYGDSHGNTMTTDVWFKQVGNWRANKLLYPDGLGIIGSKLKKSKMDFLLWFEPERARPDTMLVKEHPEWFLGPYKDNYLLNLGQRGTRKGITDLISKFITDANLGWFRQDTNIEPAAFWAAADEPDRIGMTEIRHVEGLYDFLDDLRRRHPALKIDNCSSGGRRLDLEMIKRSVPLWRSDYCGHPETDPSFIQCQTQGLSKWLPLNIAVVNKNDTYAFRSALGSGIVISNFSDEKYSPVWLGRMLNEMRETRELYTGDFYPLVSYNLCKDTWAAWQFDRKDLKRGAALFFRRPNSPFTTISARLKAIEISKHYKVKLIVNDDVLWDKMLSGSQLACIDIQITTEPGSALLVYDELQNEK